MIRAGGINSVVALGNFRVVLKKSAQSFFRKLHKSNPSYAMRIRELLIRLEKIPLPIAEYDVKKLKGYENIFRVRIGDLRVIYYVDFQNKKVVVLDINWRERVY